MHCAICAQNKGCQNQPVGAIHPLLVPKRPWMDISMDLVTGLPMDEGFDSVCMVVDRFSKEINVFPVTSKLTAQELAAEFKERIWRKHGLPKSILSDRGPQFISGFWQELLERLGVKSRLTSPYHPQGDGQTERTQRTWLQYLRLYAKENDWVSWLTPMEFAYNSAVHEATGFSPFSLSRTYKPLTGLEPEGKESSWQNNIRMAAENLQKA